MARCSIGTGVGCFLAGVGIGAVVAAATLSRSTLTQAVQDPGVRGGAPRARGQLPNLGPGGAFFAAATTFFCAG